MHGWAVGRFGNRSAFRYSGQFTRHPCAAPSPCSITSSPMTLGQRARRIRHYLRDTCCARAASIITLGGRSHGAASCLSVHQVTACPWSKAQHQDGCQPSQAPSAAAAWGPEAATSTIRRLDPLLGKLHSVLGGVPEWVCTERPAYLPGRCW